MFQSKCPTNGSGHWLPLALLCLPLSACSGGVGTDDPTLGDGGIVSPVEEPDHTSTSEDVRNNSSEPTGGGTGAPSPTSTGGTSAPDVTSGESPPEAEPTPGNALRLTQVEMNHALRDLLGDESNAANQFLPEDEYSPFDNSASRQLVSPSLIDSMHALAQDVAARVAHDATLRASWMPCEPDSANDQACFDATILELGRLFFRREISPEETSTYGRLLDYATEANDFYFGVELLLTALLQDPEFLYRLERPSSGRLNGYEIATRLSFALWGTVPDDNLLGEAAAGTLSTPEGRAEVAAEMLAAPPTRAQMFRFHSMWLGYRAIPHEADLNAAFQLETEKLIGRVVFDEPQSYLNLFQSQETYLTPALAEHYSFPPIESEGWVAYPSDSGRAGILSHGAVLSAFSKFNDTSPTQRGIFVRTRLLCQAVPPPPPAVNVDQPPGASEAEATCKLDRYRAHREQSGCMECHLLFDPIGEGLEQFDRAGRRREHDDDNETCAIDGQGELPGIGTFSGPGELASLLSQENAIPGCFVRHLLNYTRGTTTLSPGDEAFAADMTSTLERANHVIADWIPQWVGDERFVAPLEETP